VLAHRILAGTAANCAIAWRRSERCSSGSVFALGVQRVRHAEPRRASP
jgi:hypothetical protein